jgi:O-antigen/teichoic acid export membrane protein
MNLFRRPKVVSSLRIELVANFAGTGWAAIVQFICVPLFIRFMGIEAYGLIGFYLMSQAVLAILDLGISPTVNREMARYSAQPGLNLEARSLVRTLEVGYWLVGFAMGAAMIALSPWLSVHWIKASATPVGTITDCVMLMGVLAVFQWPASFYQGVFMGLRRQALFNLLKVIGVTISNGGAILVLWRFSPTIKAFLIWQILSSAIQIITLAVCVWNILPPSEQSPRFTPGVLRGIWRFAAGMSGITLIGLILTQIDKVLVSKLFSLKVFGYYTLAWTVANGLLVISNTVFNVIFPRLSFQVAAKDENGIRDSYHRGSQLMAVLIFPLAAVLALFSVEILQIWTRNREMAAFAAPIMTLLVIGSSLNAVLYLPYALQLAFGWTKLSLVAGLCSIAIIIPAILGLTTHFGALGAATAWGLLNILNMFIVVPMMHRRLLRGQIWNYFTDIGLPFCAVTAIVVVCRLAFSNLTRPGVTLAALAIAWFAALIGAVSVTPYVRSWTLAEVIRPIVQSHGVENVG